MPLEFVKQVKMLGIECGYYFNGTFLSRYKTEALAILRKRVEEAGSQIGDQSKTNYEKGKEVCPEEWKVLNEEWKKISLRTKKTEAKKKEGYYQELEGRRIEHTILTLKEKIKWKERRKKEAIEDFDKSINEIQAQIDKLELESK